MRNTIFILLMIAGTFTFNSSFAQTKIKLKPSRTLPVFENYRSSLKPYYAFSYKDKKYMLFNEVNGVYNYWVINLTFRPISCGFHFVQYDAASNKIGKQETIHTDLDVSGHSIDGAFCSNDSLIIISHLNNVNKGQVYFFATIYNLEAKKSKSFKVYDCSSSDSYSLKIYDNEQPYRFSVVSQTYKSKTVELSYLISGTNLQPISYAEKVTLKEIKRDELMDFEVTKNGNLILETAIREKKTSKGLRKMFETAPTSNELFLVRGSKLSKFETNSGSSHTFKRVFYDKNDKLKVANLYFEKNYASGGIYLADLNEENGMVENINKFDFTDMEFENAKSAKSQSRENQRTLRDINRITSIQISPEGNVYILAEHFQITKVTTTSRNANGFTTTRTSTYFDYGPGLMCTFKDSDNAVITASKLMYFNRYSTDPGVGINFFAAGDNQAVTVYAGELYRMQLGNEQKNYYSNDLRNAFFKNIFYAYKQMFNSWAGNYQDYLIEGENLYVAQIKHHNKLTISAVNIQK